MVIFATTAYFYVVRGLPSVTDLDAGLALPSTRIYDRYGRLLYEISPTGIARNRAISLDVIPDHCINALIATEDADFYHHPGVSLRGIARAVWLNLRGGDVIAGGSTITQQVARNLLLDPDARAERTIRRKLREMVLALRLQRVYDKDDMLTLWLNQTDFGNLAYGLDAAAHAYFGKPASTLSLAECALLIGIPQNPNLYDPLTNLERAQSRQGTVLDLMTAQDYITTAEGDTARSDSLQFAATPYPIKAPHAVLEVWKQLETDFPEYLYSDGLEVITTIDLDWHNAAETIVRSQLDRLNNPLGQGDFPANANNAALVAIEPDSGKVRVMLGSPDYHDNTISGALNLTLMPRQPGSTLKPFTYLLAMHPDQLEPYTAATVLMDVRTPFITRRLESYVPANFDLKEHGPVSVREALASSYNIPAVIALETVGVDRFIQFMTDLGVDQLARNPNIDLAVILGGGEVRLLNLTAAYAVLANTGYAVQPQLIERITTVDGDVLYQSGQRTQMRVIDERLAFIATDILSDDSARIPGFGANSWLNVGFPVAAKTGTTTDLRDNWVVGYTPDLAVGVWVGDNSYEPMTGVTGLSGAGPIWHLFMRDVLDSDQQRGFAPPSGLVRADVCALSGKLPTDLCTVTREEWFIEGTVPTERDDWHQQFEIDLSSGELATDDTPIQQRAQQTYVVLPAVARDWGLRNGIQPPPTTHSDTFPQDRFRIVSPDPFSTYELSTVLPRESQRLRFLASVPQDTVAVTYFLNGEPIGTSHHAPFDVWWQMDVGAYEAEAHVLLVSGQRQHIASITFDILPPQIFP